MIHGHGGNRQAWARELGCPPHEIIDMSSNLNPFGPPPGLMVHLQSCLEEIFHLPEADAGSTALRFAQAYDIAPERVLVGNGTTEFIYTLPHVLKTRNALIVGPTYADYADACRQTGSKVIFMLARAVNGFRPALLDRINEFRNHDTVFICNPNNPTGALISPQIFDTLCRECPETMFVIDESYLPFVPRDKEYSMLTHEVSNLIVLHSLSKIFRIPGLRVGYMVASPAVAERCRGGSRPWRVNSLALAAADYIADHQDALEPFLTDTRQQIDVERRWVMERLTAWPGLRAFDSVTTFLLMELSNGLSAADICDRLAHKKVLIRNCANFEGLSDQFIRISLQTRPFNERLVELMRHVLDGV